MYLKSLLIFNSGPTHELNLEPQFSADGNPKPLIMVGRNGAGKTNVLSTIADAILELQISAGFVDILPISKTGQRLFFRLLGGMTTTTNRKFEVSVAKFEHGESYFFYRAQSGTVSEETVLIKLRGAAPFSTWPDGMNKQVIGDSVQLNNIFFTESCTFFPVNRNEDAWWQSLRAAQSEDVQFVGRLSTDLMKPFVLQSSFALLKPWLADVILDQAIDASQALRYSIQPSQELVTDLLTKAGQGTLAAVNRVLSAIMCQPVLLTRGGRSAGAAKLYLRDVSGKMFLNSLDSLSTGQAALASIFLNIMRYADIGRPGISLEEITGISVIDEIDAHLHSDLQHDVLPALIKLFPRVQFMVTSHAPLFALGMERIFGPSGYSLIDLPSGLTVSPERFGEFQRCFDYFTETKAFEARMQDAAAAGKRPSIVCEGETDPKYMKRAAELLGYSDLAKNVNFDWIGTKEGGAAKNGGFGALDNAVRLFKHNPKLVAVPLAFIYDCDQSREEYAQTNLLVIRLPRNEDNHVRKGGIENLLPSEAFEERFFETKTYIKGVDDEVTTTTKSLSKVALCTHICERGNLADFIKFDPTLDKLAGFFGMPRASGSA